MGKTTAERQREWKKRQRAEGKKPVTVMLSDEVHNILAAESRRTGETYPVIIERAVVQLRAKSVVTSNNKKTEIPVYTPKETVLDNVTSNIDQERNRIIKRIIAMKDEQGLSFGEIARRLNDEGVETFSGKGKWHGKTVSKMYWKEKGS